MDYKVDLHIHSYASDGQWSGKEIIEHIDQHQVKMFAVSDHDEVGCVAELADLVKARPDLKFIKAVEISVTYEGRECHILTYGVDEKDQKLEEILKANKAIRDEYNDELIQYLGAAYPQVSLEDYKSYDYYPYQGGWMTYCYLVDRKVISGLSDYFQKINGFDYEKKFPTPDVMLKKLNDLGYTTILAHPPAYVDGDIYPEESLDYWREIGIQGLECYTQYMENQDSAKYYVDYCDRHKLMITGGSDCHGGFAGRHVGYPDVSASMLRFSVR